MKDGIKSGRRGGGKSKAAFYLFNGTTKAQASERLNLTVLSRARSDLIRNHKINSRSLLFSKSVVYLIVLYEADNRVKLLHNLGRLIKKTEKSLRPSPQSL
jgi:hypothetical protein